MGTNALWRWWRATWAVLAHPFVSLLLTSFFSFTFLLLAAAAAAAVGPVYLFSRNRAQKIEFILASLQFYASAIQKNERRGSPFSSILFFFLLLYYAQCTHCLNCGLARADTTNTISYLDSDERWRLVARLLLQLRRLLTGIREMGGVVIN